MILNFVIHVVRCSVAKSCLFANVFAFDEVLKIVLLSILSPLCDCSLLFYQSGGLRAIYGSFYPNVCYVYILMYIYIIYIYIYQRIVRILFAYMAMQPTHREFVFEVIASSMCISYSL